MGTSVKFKLKHARELIREAAEHLKPRWRRKSDRPDLEDGMSSFTPDPEQKDKSEVTDRGRISKSFNQFGDV